MIDKKFVHLFYTSLDMSSIRDKNFLDNFWYSIHKYLSHGRGDKVNGRTYEYVEKQLQNLIHTLDAIGYNKHEMAQIICNLPTVLNMGEELYKKYLFLAVIENEGNNIRKNKILNRTKDIMAGFPRMYARYKLICYSGYNKPSWSNIVHASTKEFLSVFIKDKYEASHQVFKTFEEGIAWLESVDVNEFSLEDAKSWDINKEFVKKYENKSVGK